MLRARLAFLFSVLAASTVAIAQDDKPPIDMKSVRTAAEAASQAGDHDAAAAGFRKLTEANPRDAGAWHMLGYSLHAAGKLDEALPVHLKAAEFPGTAPAATYNVACVHALKGRPDEAFTWLDKAVGLGFSDADLLDRDTDMESLRKDARFTKLRDDLRAKAANQTAQAFAQTTERRSSRVAWFGKKDSPGQISLDYAPVPWNQQYEQVLTSGKLAGKKWRFGSDFWTTLDTSIELRFGEVVVPAGYWYLTLEQRAQETFVLALHDPVAVKQQKLDPVFASKLRGGIEVTLQHTKIDDVADRLEVTIAPVGPGDAGSLTIRFGGHQLSSPVTMKIE